MVLTPRDWEPLEHAVGPFGPTELEIREYQENPSQAGRKWQLRIAARPDVVSLVFPSDFPPPPSRSLDDVTEIKSAIASKLAVLVPRTFDKEKGSIPKNFRF